MNYFIIFTLISAVTCATLEQESKWEQFKLKFKKNFRSLTHENERKAIFMSIFLYMNVRLRIIKAKSSDCLHI